MAASGRRAISFVPRPYLIGMFIGHYALAYGAKRIAPRPSLGWLFAAGQWPDLVWPIFSLIGMEHFRVAPGDTAFAPLAFEYYPWSHSILMALVWAAALALFYLARRGDRRGAWIIAALVTSHWVLDWITHRPDMPLSPSNDHRFGLGLWNNVPLTITVEVLPYFAAVTLYHVTTRPIDRVGRFGSLALAAGLLAIYLASAFSPPPPNTTVVSVSALALWILLPTATRIDRRRVPSASPSTADDQDASRV